MQELNNQIIETALDLNDTVAFEYDITNDVIRFSDNVRKYMPCTTTIASYVRDISVRGKIHPDDIKKFLALIEKSKDDTKMSVTHIRYMDFAGEYPWYQVKYTYRKDKATGQESLNGVLIRMEDQDAVDKSASVSNRDPLTLLDNKDTVIAKVNTYMDEMPDDVLAGLMIIDLDDFEYYRATAGVGAGDSVILEVARILRRALRGADIIGRYEGDQFLVCMKGVHDEKVFCERATYIIDSIKSEALSEDNEVTISASVGISVIYDHKDLDFTALYDKALIALESAKTEDKGAFVLYSDEIHHSKEYKNIRISGREVELVKSILDPINTWAYAVDEQHNLIYINQALSERMNIEGEGICYSRLKGYTSPCPDCPIFSMKDKASTADCMVYSPSLRNVIPTRVNRITLRNRSKIYILANVHDDIARQMDTLKESSQRYADAIFQVNDIIWDINLTKNSCIRLQEDKVLSINSDKVAAYNEIRNYFRDNVVHPEDRELFNSVTEHEHIKSAITLGMTSVRKEMRLNTLNGYRWYSITAVIGNKNDEDDDVVFISGRDIHKLREETIEKFTIEEKYKKMMQTSSYQMEVAVNNERYEHVNELTGIYVFEYDMMRGEYYICTTFDSIFDIKPGMLDNEWSLLDGLLPYDEDEEKYLHFVNLIKTEPDTHSTTLRLMTAYNKPVWFTITVQTLKGMNNALTRITGVLQNVNNEMEIKAELEFRADYDSMTGLYNSEHFYRSTRERIHADIDGKYAIIGIDIKRFKIINDRFGIESGNNCLKFLGSLIKKSIPWDGIAGHYQADVFSVLLKYNEDDEILEYMTKLSQGFQYEDAHKCGSMLSFGVYKIHDRDIPVRLMCDRARFSKRDIKDNAFINYAVYDDKLRLEMRERSEIESEMRAALSNREFVMYLQPKYDAQTEKICGAEALVRWKHPTKGIRMPGDFLPLFENNGFVKHLDEYMWEVAVEFLARLKEASMSVPISVNVSRVHIHNKKIVDFLNNLVREYGINKKFLELEITESYFLDDTNVLYDVMRMLKKNGYTIEMDDFGSGFSSLNMLRQAPIDVVKIDRFFLDEIMDTSRGKIVIENSIRMSKQLGMTVCAEGVETKEQLEFIRNAGCDVVQGYYYSKPIPAEEFYEMLKKERS